MILPPPASTPCPLLPPFPSPDPQGLPLDCHFRTGTPSPTSVAQAWAAHLGHRRDAAAAWLDLQPTTNAPARPADLVCGVARSLACHAHEPLDLTTDHALLVLLGQYAQHLGLIERLQSVPLKQRTRQHAPQTKRIQFLVGILAGIDYLQDFNAGPHPLVSDQAVCASWLQPAFAHYSGVSRTLAAADQTTLAAVQRVLHAVSHPFIEREVLAVVRAGQPLVIDVDLTGRPVSATSTTFPGADFGWMDDAVAKGYQTAITSLSGGPSGRLLLGSQRYPGRTKSAECLQAAVRQMAQVLGLHPRRRPELVRQRLARLAPQLQQRQVALDAACQRQQHLRLTAERVDAEIAKLTLELAGVEGELAATGEAGVVSAQVSKLRSRLSRLQRQADRLVTQVQTAVAWGHKQAVHLSALQEQEQQLTLWLQELGEDTPELVMPVRILLRVDGGFSTGENLAWLIEAGYDVVSKVHSGQTSTRLQRMVRLDAKWITVGGNAEAVRLPAQQLADCPYAVEVLLVRYQLPCGPRSTALIYYGETAPPAELTSWFQLYNARQIMEAGIKEQKGVFTMRRPLVRSPIGLELQEQFSLFAANFVRWAAQWAREQAVRQATRGLQEAWGETKTLVRVVGQTRARLVQTPEGRALVFAGEGPFAGSVLVFVGQVVYQEVLPLFRSQAYMPCEVT